MSVDTEGVFSLDSPAYKVKWRTVLAALEDYAQSYRMEIRKIEHHIRQKGETGPAWSRVTLEEKKRDLKLILDFYDWLHDEVEDHGLD